MEGRAISLEEKQALRCDIQEQEVLMQGYQKVSTAIHWPVLCTYVDKVLVFVVNSAVLFLLSIAHIWNLILCSSLMCSFIFRYEIHIVCV